jgi:hypothetical protein
MTNDPKDRHVLAAAVESGAQTIVTANLRDFPTSALTPHQIEALSPDAFLLRLLQQFSDEMKQIIIKQAQFLRNPPTTTDDLLAALSVHAPQFCQHVRSLLTSPNDED